MESGRQIHDDRDHNVCDGIYSAHGGEIRSHSPCQSSILLEEGALMALTILLAVWAISNKGRDKVGVSFKVSPPYIGGFVSDMPTEVALRLCLL